LRGRYKKRIILGSSAHGLREVRVTLRNIARFAAPIIAAAFLALPQDAKAADCRPFLAGPSNAEIPALNKFAIVMVVMSRTGQASYARGAVAYRGPLAIAPGVIRPAMWRTSPGQASELFNLEPILTQRQLPPPDEPFQHLVDIQISVGITARVSLKFAINNEIVQFDGTCSAGGVIHGTRLTRDYLLFLKRPEPGGGL
jgi:hypothetical protein